MIKKLLLLLTACFFLSGCNSHKENIVLDFATWGSASEMKIMRNIINDFEAMHPTIKINVQHIPQNYFKKLHLLFASNSTPDVILINNQNIPTYADFLITFNPKDYQGFFPNAIKGLSHRNELKAAPRDISTLVIYYNKNLTNPTKSWTYTDFMSEGARLQQQEKFLIALERDIFYLYPFILSEGEDAKSIKDNNLDKYNSVKLYKNLSEKYHYAPLLHEIGMATPAEFFLNQKCAYYLSGRWMTPKITEQATFEWGIIEFPRGKAGSVVPCDATGWAVTKNSKHLNEALTFVKYLSSETSLRQLGQSGLIVPANINSAKSTAPNIFIQTGINSSTINYPVKYDKLKDKINQKLKNP